MNVASLAGSLFLLVIGAGFLSLSLLGRLRRDDPEPPSSGIAIWIDLVVGLLAVTEAAMSVVDQPLRELLWWSGSLSLASVLVLLTLHHRRSRQDHRWVRSHAGQA